MPVAKYTTPQYQFCDAIHGEALRPPRVVPIRHARFANTSGTISFILVFSAKYGKIGAGLFISNPSLGSGRNKQKGDWRDPKPPFSLIFKEKRRIAAP